MKRLRELTIGELAGGIAEYRGFVAVVAALVAILAILPAHGDGKEGRSLQVAGAAAGRGGVGTTDGSAAADGTVAGDGGSGSVAGASAGGPGSAVGPSGSTGPQPAARGAAAGTAYPGLGTPAALDAADCDRATGHLRIPTKAWALPCAIPWPRGADNGGATTSGITGDTIKVLAYYQPSDPATENASKAIGVADDIPSMKATMEGWAKLFNRHAEMYGRHIALIHMVGSGTSDEAMRADAIEAVNKYHPFATITPQNCLEFTNQMALRKVVSICSGPETLRRIQAAAPYYWQTGTGSTVLYEEHLTMSAEFLCKRINGHPARWAGDPTMRSKPRKFGWLYLETPEVESAKRLFADELASCGITAETFGLSVDQAQATEQLRSAIAKFKSAGVNVVIVDCGFINAGLATKEATNQAYRPEWFASGYFFTDATIFIRATYDLSQAAALYGFRETVLAPPQAKSDAWGLYRWENGGDPPAKLFGDKTMLPTWHALAAGIMLAGPHLTPESFRDGLYAMPPLGGGYEGFVSSAGRSFGPRGIWPWDSKGDTTAVDDTTFTWWSNSATGQDEAGNQGTGMMMFIDGGKRYRSGTIPRGEPDFFDPANAIAQISDLAPAERPPAYPNKTGCTDRSACYPAG